MGPESFTACLLSQVSGRDQGQALWRGQGACLYGDPERRGSWRGRMGRGLWTWRPGGFWGLPWMRPCYGAVGQSRMGRPEGDGLVGTWNPRLLSGFVV